MQLSTISVVLNLIFGEAIETQFRRDALLPNLLPVEYESNSTCTWKAKFEGRNTAAPKAEGYTVQSGDYSTDTRLQASLAWAHYEAYWKVSGTAQRVAAANGQQGENDLLEEIRDAVEELAAKIGDHTYSGNVTDTPVEIEGLARAVDSTGTYAGIAQSSYSGWASGENSIATADLSINNIRTKLFRPFKDATGRMPSIVTCNGTLFDAVVSLFDEKTTIQVTTITTADGRQVDIGKLGFRGIMVDGVPFIEDRHCTANTFYALDLSVLSYRQTPPTWTNMDPGQLQGMIKQVTGQVVDVSEIAQMLAAAKKRLTFQVNALAKNGDASTGQLVIDLQLRLKRRNAAAKLVLT